MGKTRFQFCLSFVDSVTFLYYNFLTYKMGEPWFLLVANCQSNETENNEVIKHHRDEHINPVRSKKPTSPTSTERDPSANWALRSQIVETRMPETLSRCV